MTQPNETISPDAPVWPPTPACTPTVFTVEGVTVVKMPEHLVVDNPKIKRTIDRLALLGLLLIFVENTLLGYRFLHNVTGVSLHTLLRVLWRLMWHPILNAFTQLLLISLAIFVVFSVLLVWLCYLVYFLSYGNHSVVILKTTRQVTSGTKFMGGTGQVRGIIIRTWKVFGWKVSNVYYQIAPVKRSNNDVYAIRERPFASIGRLNNAWGRALGSFRDRENAERLAQEIGQFLGLPVERSEKAGEWTRG